MRGRSSPPATRACRGAGRRPGCPPTPTGRSRAPRVCPKNASYRNRTWLTCASLNAPTALDPGCAPRNPGRSIRVRASRGGARRPLGVRAHQAERRLGDVAVPRRGADGGVVNDLACSRPWISCGSPRHPSNGLHREHAGAAAGVGHQPAEAPRRYRGRPSRPGRTPARPCTSRRSTRGAAASRSSPTPSRRTPAHADTTRPGKAAPSRPTVGSARSPDRRRASTSPRSPSTTPRQPTRVERTHGRRCTPPVRAERRRTPAGSGSRCAAPRAPLTPPACPGLAARGRRASATAPLSFNAVELPAGRRRAVVEHHVEAARQLIEDRADPALGLHRELHLDRDAPPVER